MQKIIVVALAAFLSLQVAVSAFEIKTISPDVSELTERNIDLESDKNYLRGIVDKYRELYVVEEKEHIDISEIDKLYKEISKPISLAEVDSGKINLNVDVVKDEKLRNCFKHFKVLGGLAGYTVEFEPVMYFNIYRDISLVGGYSCYKKMYTNPDASSWVYINNLESLTKEILSYNTRLKLSEKITELDSYISGDNRFKIFLLKDGKIDSVWERDSI